MHRSTTDLQSPRFFSRSVKGFRKKLKKTICPSPHARFNRIVNFKLKQLQNCRSFFKSIYRYRKKSGVRNPVYFSYELLVKYVISWSMHRQQTGTSSSWIWDGRREVKVCGMQLINRSTWIKKTNIRDSNHHSTTNTC